MYDKLQLVGFSIRRCMVARGKAVKLKFNLLNIPPETRANERRAMNARED
jgi:hypothetical protein